MQVFSGAFLLQAGQPNHLELVEMAQALQTQA